MTENELKKYLKTNFSKEGEAVEWKDFSNLKHNVSGRKCDDIISYISAISNQEGGFLVIGVEDKTLEIKGIQDFHDYSLENICARILRNISGLHDLKIQEFKTTDTNKIIWIFKIPKHKPRTHIIAHNTFYLRKGDTLIDRGDELEHRKQEILKEELEMPKYDWSAQICEGATIDDLDEEAIEKAKKQAIEKATGRKKEILQSCQTNLEFLDKARITKNGQITNTAIILLGKEERAFDLIPYGQSLEIIWIDMLTGQKREGGKFYPPFILSVDGLASQIRISKHDYMERIAGMPTTNRRFVPQYELKSIREALHNCIAHQDYQANIRVILEEHPNKLFFKNAGYSKITDQEYEKMIVDTFTPEDYRNPFLAKAMDTVNMIERLGSGQKSIFDYAKSVFLPLPDRKNDISKNRFEYTIYGSKIDEAFAQILQDRKDLDIGMILLLDRVQKYAKEIASQQINKDQYKILKKQKLVEGRYPKLYLSAEIMEVLDRAEEHIKIKGFEEIYYIDLIISYLEQYSKALRVNISTLLQNKLPEDGTNKYEKVSNILRKMKKYNIVDIDKSKGTQNASWYLTSNYKQNIDIYKQKYKRKP